MKTKQLAFLVLVLLFSYQNCSRSNFGDELAQKAQAEARIHLSDIQVQQVKFNTQKEAQIQKGSATFKVLANVQYVLDPETGVLAEYDESADSFTTYCLTESLLVEARNILSAGELCKAPAMPPETVCATVITPPYAELVTQNDVIKLMPGLNACYGGHDLCVQPSSLKNWIETVKSQLPQLTCGN